MKNAFFCLLATSYLTACDPSSGTKKGDGAAVPVAVQYFTNGDPKALIKNARLNRRSPLTAETITMLNDFLLSSKASIMEKEKTTSATADTETLKKENAPNEAATPNDHLAQRSVQVSLRTNGAVVSILEGGASLIFKSTKNGSLQLVQVRVGQTTRDVHVLHWSMADNHRAISVLFEIDDNESGHELVALTFEKKENAFTPIRTNPTYQYLTGPGIGEGWSQDEELRVQICGARQLAASVRGLLNQWQTALNGRLRITVSETEDFPPFSDLNQHCIVSAPRSLFEST